MGFIPCGGGGPTEHTQTTTITKNTTTDLGEEHEIRYITTNVALVHKSVSIGTATSYNVTGLCSNYKNLTTNNFAVSTQGYGTTQTGYKKFSAWTSTLDISSKAWHTAPSISSYNASSGIIYINQGKSGGSASMYNNTVSGELTLGVTLHLFYVDFV